ncbi:hypothetical protein LAU_0036 [Lausannevirus]|uniref:Uncharacterized protein n=1 Tax=Lausannevirus TaxID=999883 RepID=F2WKW9_9VIRU|nr:hypothetical protein LAU_0036 [Lausannevirus]AEA06892.1 hypothetical protein LAU_0036 [Lausannevirus]
MQRVLEDTFSLWLNSVDENSRNYKEISAGFKYAIALSSNSDASQEREEYNSTVTLSKEQLNVLLRGRTHGQLFYRGKVYPQDHQVSPFVQSILDEAPKGQVVYFREGEGNAWFTLDEDCYALRGNYFEIWQNDPRKKKFNVYREGCYPWRVHSASEAFQILL